MPGHISIPLDIWASGRVFKQADVQESGHFPSMSSSEYSCGFCVKGLLSQPGLRRHLSVCHRKATEGLLELVHGLQQSLDKLIAGKYVRASIYDTMYKAGSCIYE